MGNFRRKLILWMTCLKLVLYFKVHATHFPLDSELCGGFGQCWSKLGCECDELCGFLNDCCGDKENVTDLKYVVDQFSCTYVKGTGKVMLVTKCAENWHEPYIRRLCEQEDTSSDTISKIIVSDPNVKKLNYRNMYCALCNHVYDYTFWKVKLGCNSQEINESCTIYYKAAIGSYRDCKLHESKVIKNCDNGNNNTQLKQECEKGRTLLVYALNLVFKNEACAKCNQNKNTLSCMPATNPVVSEENVRYTLSVLVNFNSKQVLEDSILREKYPVCANNQHYDPISNNCRNIFCPLNLRPSNGKCVANKLSLRKGPPLLKFKKHKFENTSKSEQIKSSANDSCIYSKISSNEFEYLNKTNQIKFRQKIYNGTKYIKNGSDIFLCMPTIVSSERLLQVSDQLERYMSLIGLIISILSLIVTVVVYLSFKELLNIPGKNLVSLCIALLIAQSLFLLSTSVVKTVIICPLIAICMHYFFLAAFSWMNVIAFDMLGTFSTTAARTGTPSGIESERFCKYKIYGWCMPMVIVSVAVVTNFAFSSESLNGFHPNYGNGVCWITSRSALVLFFVGPLAVFKLFDFIAFAFTVYFITKARNHGAKARKGVSTCSLFIYIKLCCVMGLTWVFAFIANFGGSDVFWYIYIVFNSLQGLFIAVSFVCTKRVFSLIKSKFEQRMSKSNTTIPGASSTRTTSA